MPSPPISCGEFCSAGGTLQLYRDTTQDLWLDHSWNIVCWGDVSVCARTCAAVFSEAQDINGLRDLVMFWGRGNWLYLLPLLRSCDRTCPGGGCHVTADPVIEIVAMATRRFNELMNHSGTPQLRHISVSLRARRGERRGGVGYRVCLKQSRGPRWSIVRKCSESEFSQGSS